MTVDTAKTDEQIESRSVHCEIWIHVSAAVVILGVILEIYIAYENPPYGLGLQRWGSLIADIMIATGVAGEVLFGTIDSRCQSELRRRSNQRLSEALTQAGKAHERAAGIELEAAQLRKELAPRGLSEKQYEILLSLRDKVESVGISSFPDSESFNFARQIAETLKRAGVTANLYDPRVGMAWTGIYVVVPTALMDYRLEPISAVFRSAGFHVGCGTRDHFPLMGLPKDIPIIMVGEKRGLPQSSPPYVFTLPKHTYNEGKAV
jgi:hypothetical protein